ncbi:hypothetical protein ACFWM3_23605 [Gottfriedia sp. NPDC058432]|uniref:hypothetical protein n=1 Tax=Bacillaceae TaxID=186817 RepID=UPI000A5F49E2|nr:hypothetical protein [Bacillus sp. FJAT-25509]
MNLPILFAIIALFLSFVCGAGFSPLLITNVLLALIAGILYERREEKQVNE